MAFGTDVHNLSLHAMQALDLRLRQAHSSSAQQLVSAPGIDVCYETQVVAAIYETATSIGFIPSSSIEIERRYPGDRHGNPKRADLAFKGGAKGQGWSYVEVKYWDPTGVRNDVEKLRSITGRTLRYILTYRVRPREKTSHLGAPLQTLEQLTESLGATQTWYGTFDSNTRTRANGIAEVWLGFIPR